MPALSLSLISPALEQLQDLPAGDCAPLSGQCPGLLEYLAQMPDPRDPRGVRHTLTSLLLAAVAAVLAGARSFTASASGWRMRRRRSWPPSASAMIRWRGSPGRQMKPPSAGSWKPWTQPPPTPRWVPGSVRGCGPLTGDRAWPAPAAGAGGGRQGGAGHPACQQRRAGRAPAGGHRSASRCRARPGGGGRQDQRDHPVRPAAGTPGPGRVRDHRGRDCLPSATMPSSWSAIRRLITSWSSRTGTDSVRTSSLPAYFCITLAVVWRWSSGAAVVRFRALDG